MKEFMVSEKFRMEVHWEKVNYKEEDIANIQGCYLSGPVLKEVEQLNEEDFIKLDFASQYIIFVKNYYIAKLSWRVVKYTPEKIFLYNVKLENMNINVVPKLRNNDYIVIDTENHEDEKHQYNMTYSSYLLKADGSQYNFSGSK
jgi:hypothetical protein